ncbi:ribosomal protein L34 [Pestalotiopsis sp. NC0098]|nr:ribosomal protein L34 [Pestalotiopsis sp. NC0098]
MRSFTTPLTALARATRAASQSQCLVGRRTFTSLPTLRPTLARPTGTVFRTSTPSLSLAPSSSETAVADIAPQTAISSSPIFGATQIRCGPRPTMARSSRLVRKRRHGFLSRVRTRTGRRTLQHRRTKSRHILSN